MRVLCWLGFHRWKMTRELTGREWLRAILALPFDGFEAEIDATLRCSRCGRTREIHAIKGKP